MLLRMGLVPVRVRRGQAVVIAPTERPKLRRQMTAAADKTESVWLSLFMEVNSVDCEEDHDHALLGRGCGDELMEKRTAESMQEADP